MTPVKRAESLFDQAKKQGMVNPITGDGAPSLSMVIDAIHDADADGYQSGQGDKLQGEIQRQNLLWRALHELNNRVHSGYDFNADPDGITKLVGDALNGSSNAPVSECAASAEPRKSSQSRPAQSHSL